MAVMGLIPVQSASQLEADEMARRDAEAKQLTPLVQGLAAHVKSRWTLVNENRSMYEERLTENLLQRRGEYSSTKLAEIKEFGGSEIFLNITSTKCRAGSAWLRDTLMGNGSDKPWGLDATPIPDLPPDVIQQIHDQLTQMVMQYIQQTGAPPDENTVRQQAEQMRDNMMQGLKDEARKRVDRMEQKMEDQLIEGRFPDALSQFIDDLTTFPLAILKGPVTRNRKTLKWNGDTLDDTMVIRDEWERTDPFKFYYANWMSNPNDGPVIERHQLTRSDLVALKGVEGYSSPDIDAILTDFDGGGLRSWLDASADSVQNVAEGKGGLTTRDDDLIDALQLWDEVSGSKLREWGMDEVEVPDAMSSYPCELWLIGTRVIKAVLNYDPLGRKPYFVTAWEKIPGTMLGNGIPDLIRDPQNMCNASARALSNNMGISSGPQVGINVDRLPTGEKVTKMYPWKIHQYTAADYQDGTPPIQFFQPNSNAQELLGVFERFASMADEYSGIPKYLQGEHTPGVGRTSSGLSMLLGNASKGMKQVVSNIDNDVIKPMVERQYHRNLRYSQDPDLIGDVNIIAKGAMSLVVKEAAAVRRNEFLQLALNSPVAQQIIGIPGTAELLREAAKQLDMNTNRIVPPREQIEQMVAQQAAQQQMMLQAAMNPEMESVEFHKDDQGAVTGATKKRPKQLLPDGSTAGGRDGSLAHNRVSGSNGLGGK
jgi:hypothetical protein